MTTVAELNYLRKQAGLPLIRFDLRKLRPEDIQDLRAAYAAMYEISDIAIGDSRGYTALARGHGYDQDLCHRDSRLFRTSAIVGTQGTMHLIMLFGMIMGVSFIELIKTTYRRKQSYEDFGT